MHMHGPTTTIYPEKSRRDLAIIAMNRPTQLINQPSRTTLPIQVPPRLISVEPVSAETSTLSVPQFPALPPQPAATLPPRPTSTKQYMDIAPIHPRPFAQQPTTTNNTTLPLNSQVPSLSTLSGQTSTATSTTTKKPSFRLAGFIIGFVATVAGGAILLNAFIFQSYYVDGLSMQPTLQDNDRLIVSKVEKTSATVSGNTYMPKRGQIVVVNGAVPTFSGSKKEPLIIKRVIGLPGETVLISNGVVTVSSPSRPAGFNVDIALGIDVKQTYSQAPLQVLVPQDSVFVLGDNRAEGESYDSRAFGPVKTDEILGRLWVRVLPITDVHVF